MLSKNEAKYIHSLSQKKQREAEGLFLVEGPKAIAEVLAAGWPIHALYATPDWESPQADLPILQRVAESEMKKISQLKTPSSVLAVLPLPAPAPPPLPHQWVLALDGLQDPGNVGTLVRIADWFGLQHVVCSLHTADPFQPKAIQASMGSFVRMQFHAMDLASFLAEHPAPVYGAVLDGVSIHALPAASPGILLLGNEGRGIDPALSASITHRVTIPKRGGAESLNAAVAGGILLSHLVKE